MDKYTAHIVNNLTGEHIPPDEPIFILRAQDLIAPEIVRFYAKTVRIRKGLDKDDPMIKGIMGFADRMEQWEYKKMPD